jgi:glutamate/tyrosine decarboxylase-like PLP-dependent enzyme
MTKKSYATPQFIDLKTKLKRKNDLSVALSAGDYDWKGGLVSGAVYYHNPDLIRLITEVYGMTSYTNPLHPDLFPGLCKMEAEVVRMACNLFHGDENTSGTVSPKKQTFFSLQKHIL